MQNSRHMLYYALSAIGFIGLILFANLLDTVRQGSTAEGFLLLLFAICVIAYFAFSCMACAEHLTAKGQSRIAGIALGFAGALGWIITALIPAKATGIVPSSLPAQAAVPAAPAIPGKKAGWLTTFCTKCGGQINNGKLLGKTLCHQCEEIARQELESAIQTIISAKELSEPVVTVLRKWPRKVHVNTFTRIYDSFVSSGEMTSTEIQLLSWFKDQLELTENEVRWNERIIPYAYLASIQEDDILPCVSASMLPQGLILKKNENVHAIFNTVLKEKRMVNLGYSGGSSGVSFRIAKGVSYRVGAHRGHINKEEQLLETSSGLLLITSQRIFLHPAPGQKPASIPLSGILSYQVYADGIEVYKNGRQKPFVFMLNRWEAEVADICLQHALALETA